MIQGKQTVADLAFNDRDWTRSLPADHRVQLRMDAVTQHPRPNRDTPCSDLQWHLGGGSVDGAFGTALQMIGPDGKEVQGAFRHR